jgi:predicted Zn finger-like uncharacterized protein
MSIIVDCPSCSRKLRVPDDLLGTKVKCPTCGGTFDAVAAPAEGAPPGSEVGPPSERGSFPDANRGETAFESPPRPDARAGEAEEDDRPWEQPHDWHPNLRRDSEPHRGGLILTLGIISIIVAAGSPVLYGCPSIVSLPLGITAWVLGGRDLKKIRANLMDPRGQGNTQAGWICGIVGTCMSLLCVTAFVIIVALFTAAVSGMFK